MMDLLATIAGYLVFIAVSVFVITMGSYWTIHRFIDAYHVRDKFLAMKGERDSALRELRSLQDRYSED